MLEHKKLDDREVDGAFRQIWLLLINSSSNCQCSLWFISILYFVQDCCPNPNWKVKGKHILSKNWNFQDKCKKNSNSIWQKYHCREQRKVYHKKITTGKLNFKMLAEFLEWSQLHTLSRTAYNNQVSFDKFLQTDHSVSIQESKNKNKSNATI